VGGLFLENKTTKLHYKKIRFKLLSPLTFMSSIFVTKDCVQYDDVRAEIIKNKKRKLSAEPDFTDDYERRKAAAVAITQLMEPKKTSLHNGEVIVITETSYMKKDYFVYRPPKQPPILIRRPCSKQGERMGYKDFKRLIEKVSMAGNLPQKLLVILIKGLDRYIHEETCPSCVENIRDSLFIMESDIEDDSLDVQMVEFF
jgi:hypothetical protein